MFIPQTVFLNIIIVTVPVLGKIGQSRHDAANGSAIEGADEIMFFG
jgi:hypothetical protein